MPRSSPSALDQVLSVLCCPICGDPLSRVESALRCGAGHSFDIARQGYVSLLTGSRPRSGDDGAMVEARERFLEGGAYAPILAAVRRLAGGREPGTVLEVGCGTGYYLAGVLEAAPAARGLGFDSSPAALRRAARAHPRAAVAAADVFRPFPVAPGSVDLVLDVFAPRNPTEFRRVLRPDGALVVARPGDGHLAELGDLIERPVGIDPEKEERLGAALDPYFGPAEATRVEYVADLSSEELTDLVAMTPNARHLSAASLDAGGQGTEIPVTVSVLVTSYRPR